MNKTTRPLVIVGAFAGSLLVGLVLMLWTMGGLRSVAAPAANRPFPPERQNAATTWAFRGVNRSLGLTVYC